MGSARRPEGQKAGEHMTDGYLKQFLEDFRKEQKEDLKELQDEVKKLHLVVAGEYVKKDELEEFRKENHNDHETIIKETKHYLPPWASIAFSVLVGLMVYFFKAGAQ